MEVSMLRTIPGLLLISLGAATALAQNGGMVAPMNADAMKWSAAPAILPQGAQMSVVSGDPSKDGLYVVRLKMSSNYKIPAHNHPTAENVSRLSRAISTLEWETS